MADRTVLVPSERLPGWVERFADRHGGTDAERTADRVTLTAPDGAVAVYDDVPPPEAFGLILVRRGGFAVGRVRAARLVDSKCGTRYVQGRTKAGGWSQQRFARRRANQAEQLARACAGAIDRVLADRSGLPVFGGGDRDLVARTVAITQPPVELCGRLLDVPEPRRQVLVEAVTQARSVTIVLNHLA
ncbi:MAG: acVLRF1 family peptidyl-tRNA hydrolase [Nocardioidaceae bacterium]